MASLLPNGEQQFCDANGAPYAGGLVYFYVPSTLTYKDTYQDAAQTILNTNPVVLDAAGRAVIYGNGDYRQRLVDGLGNLIWDQETSSVVSQAMEPVVAAATTAAALTLLGGAPASGARISPAGITVNSSDGVTVTPIGNPSQLAVNPFTGTTQSATENEALVMMMYTSDKGAGASVAASKNKAALQIGIEAKPGSGNVWAFNPLLWLDSGACAVGGAQIEELDMANNSGTDFGDAAGFAGMEQPAVFGMQITGISSNRVSAAIGIFGNVPGDITAPMWNRGIAAGPYTIRQSLIEDYSNSQQSYLIQGSHTYGIDFQGQVGTPAVFSNGAIRFGAQQKVLWRNQANTADLVMLQSTGTDQLFIGDNASAVVVQTTLSHTLGQLGFYNAAPISKPTVTGSRSNAGAITSLLNSLASLGLITNSTTP